MSNILAKWLHYFVDFPEYSGHSNQFATSHGDFSKNSGNSYQKKKKKKYILFYQRQKFLALATTNAYNAYKVYNAYNNTIIFFLIKIT